MARWVVLVPHRKFAPHTFKSYKPIAEWEEPLHKFVQRWATLSPGIPQPPQPVPIKRVYKTPPEVKESAIELYEAAKALREPPPPPPPQPPPPEAKPAKPKRLKKYRRVVRIGLYPEGRFQEQRREAAHELFLQFLDRNFPSEYELELLHGRSDP